MIDAVVGQTPVVVLQRVVPAGGGTVHLKLEIRSPNATVMDRVARALVRGALRRGSGQAGEGPWREAADGPLAIALAMQGALHGRSVEVFLPEDIALEVRQALLTYQAKVTLTPFELGGAGALAAARADGPILSDRFPNARLEAMEEVGCELLASEDQIDAFVAPLATGATLTAVSRVLRAKFPRLKRVAVRPFEGRWRPHRQHGALQQELTPLLDTSMVDATELVNDAAAWKMRERLGREEGLLLSPAAAAGVEAACRVALQLGAGAHVYALASDTGERSFSLAEP